MARKALPRNKKGQITGQNMVKIKITKALQEVAKDCSIRVKPLVRDKLERTLIANVHESFTPATAKGKEIEEYNKTHTHQKPRLYHHTGLLLENIYGVIEGDSVTVKISDVAYDNDTTVAEVYNHLKFGTTDNPDTDVYAYDKGEGQGIQFAPYIAQEPHNFEARTRQEMNEFLDRLAGDIKNNPKYYSEKYTDLVQKKFLNRI